MVAVFLVTPCPLLRVPFLLAPAASLRATPCCTARPCGMAAQVWDLANVLEAAAAASSPDAAEAAKRSKKAKGNDQQVCACTCVYMCVSMCVCACVCACM